MKGTITKRIALTWLFIITLVGIVTITTTLASFLTEVTNIKWLSVLCAVALCVGVTIASTIRASK